MTSTAKPKTLYQLRIVVPGVLTLRIVVPGVLTLRIVVPGVLTLMSGIVVAGVLTLRIAFLHGSQTKDCIGDSGRHYIARHIARRSSVLKHREPYDPTPRERLFTGKDDPLVLEHWERRSFSVRTLGFFSVRTLGKTIL